MILLIKCDIETFIEFLAKYVNVYILLQLFDKTLRYVIKARRKTSYNVHLLKKYTMNFTDVLIL